MPRNGRHLRTAEPDCRERNLTHLIVAAVHILDDAAVTLNDHLALRNGCMTRCGWSESRCSGAGDGGGTMCKLTVLRHHPHYLTLLVSGDSRDAVAYPVN